MRNELPAVFTISQFRADIAWLSQNVHMKSQLQKEADRYSAKNSICKALPILIIKNQIAASHSHEKIALSACSLTMNQK